MDSLVLRLIVGFLGRIIDAIVGSLIDDLKHDLEFLNAGFVAVEPQTGAIKLCWWY
jgi:penicillin-binding protein 1A